MKGCEAGIGWIGLEWCHGRFILGKWVYRLAVVL